MSRAAENILRAAARVGQYIPRTKEQMKLAQYLRGRDLLELSENVPGAFTLTDAGDSVLSKLETAVS